MSFLACLLVGGKLCVAPALVLRLFVGFFHEADNELLYHLFHLLEWVIGNMSGES
jgi:hypothetical protein